MDFGSFIRRFPSDKRRTRVRALFLDRDRDSIVICWVGIVLNATLIGWTGIWIARGFVADAPGPLLLGLTTLVALFVADWLSGFVHWLTDTWFDERQLSSLISIAREHHIYPHHILAYGFCDYVAYSSWPTVLLVGPVSLLVTLGLPPSTATFQAVLICFVVSVAMFFGTYAHRLGHRRSNNRLVQWMQRRHLLIDPQYHSRHHRGNHDTHYCVINGWANIVCDRIGFWRLAERLVERISGAIARHNDHQWFDRFRSDPGFPAGRIELEAAQSAEKRSRDTGLQSLRSNAAAFRRSPVSPSSSNPA